MDPGMPEHFRVCCISKNDSLIVRIPFLPDNVRVQLNDGIGNACNLGCPCQTFSGDPETRQ